MTKMINQIIKIILKDNLRKTLEINKQNYQINNP